jgi:hypothetical protein
MDALGIPDHMIDEPDYGRNGKWRAFDYRDGEGGHNGTGIVVDTGTLDSDL